MQVFLAICDGKLAALHSYGPKSDKIIILKEYEEFSFEVCFMNDPGGHHNAQGYFLVFCTDP